MLTEYHCHILPGMDDGAADPETALAMVGMMQAQGVERIAATPHFYAHREKSVEDFLRKRQAACERIRGKAAVQDIRLGAEVAVEHGISELPGIERLALEGTRLILLELPYRPYERWMSEEIYNIAAEYGLKVMLAHIHRYLMYYSKDELEAVMSSDAVLQINNEAFASWSERRLAKRILNEQDSFAFGSDAHDLRKRRPNWDLLKKKVGAEKIAVSDGLLERYAI